MSSAEKRKLNLAELVALQVQDNPDLEVLTFVTVEADGTLSDERRTFRQLHNNAAQLARALAAKGVQAGDRFAIMMQNHPECVEAMVAAVMLDAVFVPIDPRTMGEKLAYMLDFTSCKGVIAGDYCLDALSRIAGQTDELSWIMVVGYGGKMGSAQRPEYLAYPDTSQSPQDIFEPRPVDRKGPISMMFTSGTTGNPKAVVQTHAQFMVGAKGLALFGVGQGDILYSGLSLTHVNALATLRSALSLAVPAVFSRKFTKSRLWDICRAYDCTVFNLLGGMIPEMFSAPEQPNDADNPVRMIISAGMPPSLWEAYQKRFGVEICEIYGSTEGGGILYNLPGQGPIGSMGKPPKGLEAMTFNAAGDKCAPGEPGELCFRPEGREAAPITYLKNAEASDERVIDGWFRSGDLAHYDADGWFFFHHRVGGGVRRNGDFVNTALVEAVLVRSPMVDDAFVYGVAADKNVAGEKTLVAAITQADDTPYAEAALRRYCQQELQANDVPEIFQLLDIIPKTISEKPIEKECIALLKI